eukprot:429183_1
MKIAFCESKHLFVVLFRDELAFFALQDGTRVVSKKGGSDLTEMNWFKDGDINFEAMLIQEIKNDIYVWFIDNRNIVRAFDCDTNKWDQMKVFALDQKYKHYIL